MSVVEEYINEAVQRKSFGVRHIQCLMIFLGVFLAHCTRTTISLAIVDMTDPRNEHYFDWTIQRQSVILSSFTWGYVVLLLISGELTAKFGGKIFLTICVGVNSAISLILPVAANYGGWVTVCICRVIQGLAQGPLFPTIMYLLAKWVPLRERGRLASFVLSGIYLGLASQMMVSGFLANYFGWPMIFYVNGVAGLIWTAVYLFVGTDNPQASKLITTEERYYIQSSLGQIGGHKKLRTPWKSILTSLPFIATMIAAIGFSWGYWTLLTEIPTYFSKALKVDIKSNGVMSALPYLTMFAMNFPVGFTSDYIVRKNWVTLTACRKIFNSIGFFGAAISLYCLTYVPVGSVRLAVVTLCVALGFNSGYYSGFTVVYLDLAQNFSNILMSVGNFMANFIGLLAPLLAGILVDDESDPENWYIIFYISSITYIVTNVFFLLFATSKEQKWNEGTEKSDSTINA